MAVILVSVTALCKDDIGNKTISRNSNGDSSAVFFFFFCLTLIRLIVKTIAYSRKICEAGCPNFIKIHPELVS